MNDPLTLVQANITVCCVAAAGWAVAGMALQMAPVVARRFFVSNVLMACSLLLTVARDNPAFPSWLSFISADIIGLAAFAVLRLGVGYFVQRTDVAARETILLLLLASLLLCSQPYGLRPGFHAAVYSVAACWLMLRTTEDAISGRVPLGYETTAHARVVVASPLAIMALLFGVRALAVSSGDSVSASVLATTSFNIGFLFAGLVLNLGVNLALAGVVTLRLVSKLRHLSLTDPMTGALNRRAFHASLAQQHQLTTQGIPYALCVLDVDHFKRINDQLGHAAGDAALIHLVTVVNGILREQDLLCRAGGEEFYILLPDTGAAGAVAVAERLRLALLHAPFVWEAQHWPFTASFGVAAWQSGAGDAERLLQRADQAVYQAKAGGRNCVVRL